MALPGDPPGPIVYQVIDLGSGNYKLRRRIASGAQFRIIDVADTANGTDCLDFLNMAAEVLASHEGGTVI